MIQNFNNFIINESIASDFKELNNAELFQDIIQTLKNKGYNMLNNGKLYKGEESINLNFVRDSEGNEMKGVMFFAENKFDHTAELHIYHKKDGGESYGCWKSNTFCINPKNYYCTIRENGGVAEIQGTCYKGMVDKDLESWLDSNLK